MFLYINWTNVFSGCGFEPLSSTIAKNYIYFVVETLLRSLILNENLKDFPRQWPVVLFTIPDFFWVGRQSFFPHCEYKAALWHQSIGTLFKVHLAWISFTNHLKKAKHTCSILSLFLSLSRIFQRMAKWQSGFI